MLYPIWQPYSQALRPQNCRNLQSVWPSIQSYLFPSVQPNHLQVVIMRFQCGNTNLLDDIRFHFLRQTLQCSKLLKQFRILLFEEHDNLRCNVRLLLGWDIVNDTLRYQTLDGILCIHRREFSHFSRHDQSGGAPVVLPVSRQHHFRYKRSETGVSTAATGLAK